MYIDTHIAVDYNDIKLLKQLTTHAEKTTKTSHTNSRNVMNLVIRPDETIAWTTDSYRVGAVKLSTEGKRKTIMYYNAVNKPQNATTTVNNIHEGSDTKDFEVICASMNTYDFKKVLDWTLKTFSKTQVDGHTYMRIFGNHELLGAYQLGYLICEQLVYTADKFGLWVKDGYQENYAQVKADKTKQSVDLLLGGVMDLFKDLDTHTPTPIEEMLYRPQYFEDAMKLMRYNNGNAPLHTDKVRIEKGEGFYNSCAVISKDTTESNDNSIWRRTAIMPIREKEKE